MTGKIYKSAKGKSVDLGTIMLQNAHVRAVGNMNVNARGDILDSNNKVIETKNRQIQKQNSQRTVAAPLSPVHTSTQAVRKAKKSQKEENTTSQEDIIQDNRVDSPIQNIVAPAPVDMDAPTSGGGLAAAIARSKIVKQEKEKTAKEMQKSIPGVRKI